MRGWVTRGEGMWQGGLTPSFSYLSSWVRRVRLKMWMVRLSKCRAELT
jgi:hypothetical protein